MASTLLLVNWLAATASKALKKRPPGERGYQAVPWEIRLTGSDLRRRTRLELHNRPEISPDPCASAVVLTTVAFSGEARWYPELRKQDSEVRVPNMLPGQLGAHLGVLRRAAPVEDRRHRRAEEVK